MTDTNENKPLETWIKDNQHSAPSGTNTFVINVLRLAEFERLVRQEEREIANFWKSEENDQLLQRLSDLKQQLAAAKEEIAKLRDGIKTIKACTYMEATDDIITNAVRNMTNKLLEGSK